MDQQNPPTPDATQTVAAAPPTAESIAAAVQAGIQAHQASTQSAPREMTPEERAQYLQIFDPNEDGFVDNFVSTITNTEATPEQRLQVIEHFRDGVANQSIRGAEILVQQQLAELRKELAPVLQQSQETNAEKAWAEFSASHPDLKEQRSLVDMVSNQLYSQGYRPKDRTEAFTRAAEVTRTTIQQMTGKLPAATPSAPSTMPRMTQTSTTPAGAGGPQTEATPGVASFFQKRRR